MSQKPPTPEEAVPKFKLTQLWHGICCRTCHHRFQLAYEFPEVLCCNRDDAEISDRQDKDRHVAPDVICEHYRHAYMSQELNDRLMRVLREYWTNPEEFKP